MLARIVATYVHTSYSYTHDYIATYVATYNIAVCTVLTLAKFLTAAGIEVYNVFCD